MRTRIQSIPRLVTAVALLMACVPGALAFYPFGFFNDETGGELVFIKWPLSDFDTDGDGDVTVDEGLELNFEFDSDTDPNFFTEAEVNKVLAGFTEWELVSTAFVAFRRGQDITDPVELGAGLESIDAFNVVVFESEEDIVTQGGSLTGGSFVATLTANSFEDTFVTIGGSTFPVPGGRMLDVDTVFAAQGRELEAIEPGTLKGTAVLAGGGILGLNWSPLTNINEGASEANGRLIEDRVVAIRNFDGTMSLRGVTSSMFNEFYVYDIDGNFVDSAQDLAPDDISGITFMYPRTDQDLFFDINQKARTRANTNVSSQPISGAWIRAWADADNTGNYVPMFDTLTGLYENLLSTNYRGHFELKGLFKQLETFDEQAFSVPYVITCSEFLPILFGGDERPVYDSTHAGFSGVVTGTGIAFDSLFPAEVFNETGNKFGLANIEQGTPLIFDLFDRKVVSADSGKSLDVLLAAGRPMFGEQNTVCPLNVIVTPIDDGTAGLASIRAMRDENLLQSAVGVAIADVYYRMAPSAAAFLNSHSNVLASAQSFYIVGRWILHNAEYLMIASGLLLIAAAARRRASTLRTVTLLVCCFSLVGSIESHARMMPYDIPDYLAMSDDVIVGTVKTTESRWIQNNTKIITNVAIQVETSIKGDHNAGNIVHLQLPTGRVGAIGRSSSQLPEFASGEHVLVFLELQKNGYMVVGGVAGKFLIAPHPRTGDEYVFATSQPGNFRLEKEVRAMLAKHNDGAQDNASSEILPVKIEKRAHVKLSDFVKHLRELNREQQKNTLTAKRSD